VLNSANSAASTVAGEYIEGQCRPSVSVIVNADDFGMEERETDAICDGMANGRITSATIVANGVDLHRVLRQIRLFRHCSFGVHLNITQGFPLSHRSDAKLLVDADGKMGRGVVARLRPRPAVLRAVYGEWCTQVSRLITAGITIGHLDSHHHVHTLPVLFPVLKAVQKRFGIRKVRISKNIYSASDSYGLLLQAKKNVFNFAVRTLYRTRTTTGFTDLVSFCAVGRHGLLRHSVVEVMVHPAAKGNEVEDRLLNSDWENTLAVLIRKISYNQL
jgi:predicted glycoside hydrolase/deacetylase ChbG (UPF0249 family)